MLIDKSAGRIAQRSGSWRSFSQLYLRADLHHSVWRNPEESGSRGRVARQK
jgi:hypothetical protein